ncbi:B2 bradykinin receptor-like [Megalops cyprinoides]|uniref:B2 bradykinin receptor-like n=1 Tax=Megalops cyprinoides TaxID=118141 RepID=UPI001863A6E4|nr:B2 bradykinin receptor-like [Megalops cyprinoides]
MPQNLSDSLALIVMSDVVVDPCNDTTAWDWVYTIQPAYMAVICVLGAVGNAFVICILCQQRRHRTVADVYLCNLAAADLVLVSCLPFWVVAVAGEFHWPFGELLCKLINTAISSNYFCSVLSLVLVSVDRYLALAHPLTFGRLRGVARARRLCLAVWVASVALSLPNLAFRTVRSFPELGVEACYLAYPHGGWRVQRNVTTNVVGFLVPVPVLTFCSYRIVYALRDSQPAGARSGLGAERKATRLVLVVFAVFILCWLPHQVFRFLDTLDYFQLMPSCTWGYVLDIGTQLSTYLAYGNSALNPLLYVMVGKQFRKKARGVFACLLARDTRSKSSLTIHLTSTVRCNESTKISLEQFKIQFPEKL